MGEVGTGKAASGYQKGNRCYETPQPCRARVEIKQEYFSLATGTLVVASARFTATKHWATTKQEHETASSGSTTNALGKCLRIYFSFL